MRGRSPVRAADLSPSAVYASDPMAFVNVVRGGIPAAVLPKLAKRMDVTQEWLLRTLDIAPATAARKISGGQRLSVEESERTLDVLRLVGRVERIVAESGAGEAFDAARWTAEWLDRPNAALGGQTPGSLMDTAQGRTIVAGLVAQMQSGAYA